MIIVDNVRKIYGKKNQSFTALKDVSFSIPEGASVAIIGKSGSGKSTLMHVMSGLDSATKGVIKIHGDDLAGMKKKAVDKFRNQEIGFIFQSFFVEGNQTVLDNVTLPLEIAKVGLRKRRSIAREALKQVELIDKAKEKARNLSGGQKQRLAIARAIVNKPKIIFADEPTGNLDSVTGKKIIKLLFDLNKKLPATLIIVTHDSELAALCEIQLELKDGQLVKTSKKRAAKNSVSRRRRV